MEFGDIIPFDQLQAANAADETRGYAINLVSLGRLRLVELVDLEGLNITRSFAHIRLGYTRKLSATPQGRYHPLGAGYNVHTTSSEFSWTGPLLVKADGLVALITAEDGDNVIFRGSYRDVLE